MLLLLILSIHTDLSCIIYNFYFVHRQSSSLRNFRISTRTSSYARRVYIFSNLVIFQISVNRVCVTIILYILLCIMYRDVPSYVSLFFYYQFFFSFLYHCYCREIWRFGFRYILVVQLQTLQSSVIIRKMNAGIVFFFFFCSRRSEYLLKFNNDIPIYLITGNNISRLAGKKNYREILIQSDCYYYYNYY